MNSNRLGAGAIFLCLAGILPAQETILLWPGGAPGALGTEDADKPSLTAYLPPKSKSNGTGIVVCPGGGYGHLAMDHEGKQIAEWLNQLGVAAFVLKYRLGPRYMHPAPLNDAKRAMRIVRFRQKEFGVDNDRVGIWGFSAGGHLASTVGTHFDKGNYFADDPIERKHSRPDFMILTYPVISFSSKWTHKGSRTNLLGKSPDAKLMEELSNEKQVTAETPPTFLFHTDADTGVPAENSVLFYLALRQAGVPAELHIYEKGQHGIGLGTNDEILATWPARLSDWMKQRGYLKKASPLDRAE